MFYTERAKRCSLHSATTWTPLCVVGFVSYPRVGISGRADGTTASEVTRQVYLDGPLHTDWARPVLAGMLRVLDQRLTCDEVTVKASVLRDEACLLVLSLATMGVPFGPLLLRVFKCNLQVIHKIIAFH
jgi:hypothetical protein